VKKAKKTRKKRKNRLKFRFALFCFEEKITKSKRSEKKQKIDLNFALLFRFEAKITQVKPSEKFEAKISEKREVKFYSEIVKHM
jgi:hypothetical protein